MEATSVLHESSLLLTLEEISRLVSHSHHPGETLDNIVRLLQGRFQTDVCSVYILEQERGELLLGATVGLRPDSVGRVRMRVSEGLTGLVAEKMTPVMVEDAFVHPRFKYFPEAGEDIYHSFLGVPMVGGGTLQGVLVVQTRERRSFSSNETRMLVTVAAQLAPLVGEAHLIEQMMEAAHQASLADDASSKCDAAPLNGTPLSPGVGVGQAYLINGFEPWQAAAREPALDGDKERARLSRAMELARAEIARLGEHVSALVGEENGAILQGQLMILQDGTVGEDLARSLGQGLTAEGALLQTLEKYVEAFRKLTSVYFQERIYDVKDVFRRILWFLRPAAKQGELANGRLVLVAHEASVMDLFSVDPERLAGIAVEHGGAQSHAAILARSLGIPMVGQVADLVRKVKSGQLLRVDGNSGRIDLDAELSPGAPGVNGRPASPPASIWPAEMGPRSDALPVKGPELQANVNLLHEVSQAIRQGASGVGLYRSEFLFLARRTLPTEEEQVRSYRRLFSALEGRPVSIRTFDLRPQKIALRTSTGGGAAQPLDWRTVLDSPVIQQLFKEQVRAIYRAASAGRARILIPFLTRTEQLDFVCTTLDQVKEELRSEGLEHATDVSLGVMIETAGAAALVDAWTDRVEFFALGTNDLLASALGMDREAPVGACPDDVLHPGFLRLIRDVILAAHAHGRRVTACGEMAADPDGLTVLTAFGIDSLSVPVSQLAPVRQQLSGFSANLLSTLNKELGGFSKARQVRERLNK